MTAMNTSLVCPHNPLLVSVLIEKNQHAFSNEGPLTNAVFRLECRSSPYRFDGDICTTAQAPLATEERAASCQPINNLAQDPQWQIADSWLQFKLRAMPFGEKAKAVWPLRLATRKRQVVIIRRSDNAASGKLVWNQLKSAPDHFCVALFQL